MASSSSSIPSGGSDICSTPISSSTERTPLILRKASTEEPGRFDGSSTDTDTYTMEPRHKDEPVGFDRSFSLTCIVLHECLHSAAFYMIVPGLLYFVRSSDMLSVGWAVIVTLIFAGVAFFLPLIGGIMGDTVMGRYSAVLFGTVIEFIGMVILLIYAIIMYFHEGKIMQWRLLPLLIVALVLVAFGMGFIKANVNPFGAGQLQETGGSVEKIQSYFRWYTFSINFGKLLAFFPVAFLLNRHEASELTNTTVTILPATPITTTPYYTTPAANITNSSTIAPNTTWVSYEEGSGGDPQHEYKAIIATLIQVCFVGVAIFIFMIGKTKYRMVPPTGGRHLNYIFCFYRRQFNPVLYHDHYEYIAQMLKYQKMVFRITFITAALFAMYIFYEAIYFQLLSTFMLQARELAQPIQNFTLPLPFMNTFQNFIIILMIPILEKCWNTKKTEYVTREEIDKEASKKSTVDRINKLLDEKKDEPVFQSITQTRERAATVDKEDVIIDPAGVSERVKQHIHLEIAGKKRRRTLLIRMCIGMGFAALVALSAGILETVRKWKHYHHQEPPSLFWQLPQYLLMGFAEVFGVISAYEFAYTESFPGVQGFTTGMFISSYGLGSFVCLFLYIGLSENAALPFNEYQMDYGYYGLCAVMTFLVLMFTILGKEYHRTKEYNLKEPAHPFQDNRTESTLDSMLYQNSASMI